MSDLLISELLILILLFPVMLRPLFIRSYRVDSVVLFAPVSLVFCILLFFIYEIQFSLLICFFMSVLVFLSNFRALIRYVNRLYIDYYTIKFKVAMFFEFLLVCASIILLLVFSPYNSSAHTVSLYSGSVMRGFVEKESIMDPINLIVTEFIPEHSNGKKLLYIPSAYAGTQHALPLLEYYQKKGYTVYSCEIYSSDVVYLSSVWNSKWIRGFLLRLHHLKDDFSRQKKLEEKAILEWAQKYHPNAVLVRGFRETGKLENFKETNPLGYYVLYEILDEI